MSFNWAVVSNWLWQSFVEIKRMGGEKLRKNTLTDGLKFIVVDKAPVFQLGGRIRGCRLFCSIEPAAGHCWEKVALDPGEPCCLLPTVLELSMLTFAGWLRENKSGFILRHSTVESAGGGRCSGEILAAVNCLSLLQTVGRNLGWYIFQSQTD